MEALPLAFTAGWASGINAYACVLLLGLLGSSGDDVAVADGASLGRQGAWVMGRGTG